ncbi:MAG: tetratricopeptide repeat protein [Gemmatimonadaceae bacterium]
MLTLFEQDPDRGNGDANGGQTLAPARGSTIAGQVGARYYVLGEVLETGGRLRIMASLYHTAEHDRTRSPSPIGHADVEGEAAQLLGLVDRLAVQLFAALPYRPTERLAHAATLTTTSLPALKAYLTGEEHYRAGRWLQAFETFQQAVREDSTFALAYYRLSMAADWADRPELVVENAERAFRWSSRLRWRDSVLVHAHRAFWRGEVNEAEALYRRALIRYPDDVEAWYRLGEVLFHHNANRGRSFTESRPAFVYVLRFEPNNEEALRHLLRIAAREGRRDEVDSLTRQLIRISPVLGALEIRAFRAFTIGDSADAARALQELRGGDNSVRFVTAWRVSVYTRNFGAVERIARVMAEPSQQPDSRRDGHEIRADIFVAQGKWRAAQAELAAISRIRPSQALKLRSLFSAFPFLEVAPPTLRQLRTAVERWDPRSTEDSTLSSTVRDEDVLLRRYFLGVLSAQLGEEARATSHANALAEQVQRFPTASAMARLGVPLVMSLRAQKRGARNVWTTPWRCSSQWRRDSRSGSSFSTASTASC